MTTECLSCGSVLGEFERACGQCLTPAPGFNPRAARLFCTACDTALPKESVFCLACGVAVSSPEEQ